MTLEPGGRVVQVYWKINITVSAIGSIARNAQEMSERILPRLQGMIAASDKNYEAWSD